MNNSLLDIPPCARGHVRIQHHVPAEHSGEQRVGIGPHAVDDIRFIRRVASDLMQCCVLHNCDLPQSVIDVLHLTTDDQNAIGMVSVLSKMTDLQQRRDAMCLMVHEIVALQKSFPHSIMSTTESVAPETLTLEDALRHIAQQCGCQRIAIPGVPVHRAGFTAPLDAIDALRRSSDSADHERALAAIAHVQGMVRNTLASNIVVTAE